MSIPSGWKKVKFGDVVNKINDKVPNRDEWTFDRFIGGEHFDEGEIRITNSAPIEGNEEVIGSAFHMRFKPGQVLYVTRNPRLRKGGMVDFEGVCSNVSFVMEADEKQLLQSLLPFIIQTEDFVEHTTNNAHGSTNPFLNWKDIAKYEFLLPPLEEQKKISEVLWAVEDQIKNLDENKNKLDKIKRRFTKELFLKGINHKKFKKTKIGEIPFEWDLKELGEFTTIKGRIGWRGLKSEEYTQNGPYLIAAKHIINDQIDWKNADHLTNERYEESPEIMLKEGDTILSKDGTIGRLAYIDKLPGKTTINSTMMLIRPDKKYLLPQFLHYYLKGEQFQLLVKERSMGSTIAHIFQRDMNKMPFPLIPMEEQKKLIKLLDDVYSHIQTLEINEQMTKSLRNKLSNELLKGTLRLK